MGLFPPAALLWAQEGPTAKNAREAPRLREAGLPSIGNVHWSGKLGVSDCWLRDETGLKLCRGQIAMAGLFRGVPNASSSGLRNRAYVVVDDAAAGGSFSGPTRMLSSSILTA